MSIFKDLKVVELASVLAGPAVGMFFAELGAEVIKIENKTTDGDITRHWKHPIEAPDKAYSSYYHSINWGKKSLIVDLNNTQERIQVENHLKDADIIISNYLPNSAKKLKLRYEDLKEINPSVIFGHISAYGINDDRPGFDALMQAETGWMHMNGQVDGPPTKMPVALIDILAAHHLKQGLLLAYIKKLKTNEGSQVSVSLFDAAIASLANQASNFLNLNVVAARKGSLHPNIAPYGEIIKSKNDEFLLLAIGNDNQFNNLLDILDLTYLKLDKKYASNTSRVKNRKELFTILQSAASKLSTEELLTKSAEKKVPIGLIRNLKKVFEDELAQELVLNEILEDGTISKRVKTVVFKTPS